MCSRLKVPNILSCIYQTNGHIVTSRGHKRVRTHKNSIRIRRKINIYINVFKNIHCRYTVNVTTWNTVLSTRVNNTSAMISLRLKTKRVVKRAPDNLAPRHTPPATTSGRSITRGCARSRRCIATRAVGDRTTARGKVRASGAKSKRNKKPISDGYASRADIETQETDT